MPPSPAGLNLAGAGASEGGRAAAGEKAHEETAAGNAAYVAKPGRTPTTKAQVSGHKFLVRRLELGLVLGDERMIHDPLGKRLRAVAFGAVACVLLCVGALGFSLMKPKPNPGDAAIVKAESGQLFVRLGEQLHPVTNLASARLLAGRPEQPVAAANSHLAQQRIGVPVGLPDAPGVFQPQAPGTALANEWRVCTEQTPNTPPTGIPRTPGSVSAVVVAPSGASALPTDAGVLANFDGADVLITGEQRRFLPSAATSFGATLRRVLGIDAATPRWYVPNDVVNVLSEAPMWQAPPGELVTVGRQAWLRSEEGLMPLSEMQREILQQLGTVATQATAEEIASLPVAAGEVPLPERGFTWINPAQRSVCLVAIARESDARQADAAGGEGGVAGDAGGNEGSADAEPSEGARAEFAVTVAALPEGESPVPGAVELSGHSTATHVAGLGTAMAIRTGNGVHVVGETGLYHVTSEDALRALGIEESGRIPWGILRLLPRGSDLTAERAAAPLY